MDHNPILKLLDSATDYQRMQQALEGGKGPVAAFGVAANAKAHLCAPLARTRQVLFVTATDVTAAQLNESVRLFGVRAELLCRAKRRWSMFTRPPARTGARASPLSVLLDGEPCVVAASAASLMQALAPKGAFAASQITISVGDTLEPRSLIERLVSAGYERVEMVEGRGRHARGDLVDVFAPGEYPSCVSSSSATRSTRCAPSTRSANAAEQVQSVLIRPGWKRRSQRSSRKKRSRNRKLCGDQRPGGSLERGHRERRRRRSASASL